MYFIFYFDFCILHTQTDLEMLLRIQFLFTFLLPFLFSFIFPFQLSSPVPKTLSPKPLGPTTTPTQLGPRVHEQEHGWTVDSPALFQLVIYKEYLNHALGLTFIDPRSSFHF